MKGKNRLFDPEDREALAEYKRQIGARITAMRKEKGMTQEMLAEEVGMNPKMISRVEVGTGNCRTWEIIGIAGALDVSVDYLLRGEGREYRYVGKIITSSSFRVFSSFSCNPSSTG